MRKHITVAVAEALAANGWEAIKISHVGRSVSVAYSHPEIEGRVTVWSVPYNNEIVMYIDVPGMEDGYYDLNTCEYVAG